mmetsp:Transcript_21955/g.45145  ORF Transcript_21955/g.45145 Transcript_21955/m.45145 type:complete len:288 (-) Transcript_21955:82-945(-)
MAVSPGLQGGAKRAPPVQLPNPVACSILVACRVRPACRYPCHGHRRHLVHTPKWLLTPWSRLKASLAAARPGSSSASFAVRQSAERRPWPCVGRFFSTPNAPNGGGVPSATGRLANGLPSKRGVYREPHSTRSTATAAPPPMLCLLVAASPFLLILLVRLAGRGGVAVRSSTAPLERTVPPPPWKCPFPSAATAAASEESRKRPSRSPPVKEDKLLFSRNRRSGPIKSGAEGSREEEGVGPFKRCPERALSIARGRTEVSSSRTAKKSNEPFRCSWTQAMPARIFCP